MKKDKFVKFGFGVLKLLPIIFLFACLVTYALSQQRNNALDITSFDIENFLNATSSGVVSLMPTILSVSLENFFNSVFGNYTTIALYVCSIVWWWFIVWLIELLYKLILFIPNKLLGVLD